MPRQQDARTEHYASVRETVESLWVAIVLAFVLRAFVLEAFMIPTGSMAPRLMGAHHPLECRACGYRFSRGGTEPAPDGRRVSAARCPSCWYTYPFPWEYTTGGDRVLVLKYLYRFREANPWDVVVFKNPQNNEENYIKRLIGLPGWQVQIVHGDIYHREGRDVNDDGVIDEADFDLLTTAGEAPWQILRKSPKTQSVCWQVIFDNDYRPDRAVYNAPSASSNRWVDPWSTEEGSGWSLAADHGRAFNFAAKGGAPTARPGEVRFTHDYPGRFLPYYAYNGPGNGDRDLRTEIVYDLNLSFLMSPESPEARVGLHLSSFDDHFIGWVGADGACRLVHGVAGADGKIVWDADAGEGRKDYGSNTLPAMEIRRAYQVSLTHVDHRVTLWLDGKPVIQTKAQYEPDMAAIMQRVHQARASDEDWAAPQELLPLPTVAMLGDGGAFILRHVRLTRDVHYTSSINGGGGHGTLGHPITLRKFLNEPDRDEFYVLGDNSPQSRDSRVWSTGAETLRNDYVFGTVPRYNMIGKAFFVYWPGGYRLPLLTRLPIVPNVGKMRLIR